MKKSKRMILLSSLAAMVLFLSACGTSEVSVNSTGIWDRYIVYYFAKAIEFLSFGNTGIGIILFTLIIRLLLFPLMSMQMKSMQKVQELQPQLKALQEKYASKDIETQNKLREETSRLYSENGANPYLGCLPLVIQLPILTALWQALSRVPALQQGEFLWLHLGQKDPYYILPILAAVFTFGSMYLSSMSQVQSNPSMKIMTYFMPLMILGMGVNLASGVALYWAVSNAFQVVQTLLINNPFKIKKEREEKLRAERAKKRALQKAMKKKLKK
ncbi:YidC/Oxa1 family membrane protein insertase [Enterococcus cecorum]|uniref:Membrane protein insertase YidC n=1 Tax=Enterococcus cecorum TaxID=44008 RepID=A0A7X9NNV1_9ENTE|nr:membrane protein insertase YidC [Enterococcus cecorum]MDY2954011.1 YidC/Oxa1 family membrane protein insertase [Enterococcus cecorum]MDZ5560465.1 YidC/Oxa1 family membrane protein insertase [Enterococcus cecorum]NME50614.1 membrane protein insertase YidC [Enterococcus cecorum]